ncbi:nucleotidyltransferase domain-containing protein [Hallella absiana]|uniref:nucleotidyltransferase domain-containing protein n=1 Tax=Hallella absiana TaxID=2925336 RepID=UPI0021CA3920|nr:nucleotidyltransferase family protein [Hallella absiana]
MYDNDYIAFLRWCLNRKVQAPSCVERINWRSLLSFAKEQTIVGIYWQGIQRLGDVANKPSEDEVMEWMGAYTQIVRRNAKTNDAVANLAKFMQSNDIGFFVFKGQAIALYYPLPKMRTSGDVDFYVFKRDWGRAKSLLEKEVTITDDHSGQHLEFTKDGVPFEMHYHTAVFASGSKQRYWDELIESYFDDILDHVVINGVEVPTLPPTLNSIYLFVHIYHHFLKEGIALRQFIDWMMFFEAKHEEIVVSELTAKLERLGLLRAFKAFGAILTDVLGMDEKFFPYALTDSDQRYVNKIMSNVLLYGNFGKYGRKEQQGGWKHSMETGARSLQHIIRFFWLSPAENLLWLPKLLRQSLIKNLA